MIIWFLTCVGLNSKMGAKHFGELSKLRGIISFRLSPHEQRAFAGALSQGIPNTFRRIWSEFFFIGVRK